MKLAWKIGRLFGIDVFIHVTFPLMILYVAWTYYDRAREVSAAIYGVFFILTVFGIVVLHELGHALTARKFGIGTRDIILLPIGGVARLERMPEDPKKELLIAVAGPAVNVVLAALCWVLLFAFPNVSVPQYALSSKGFIGEMMAVNIVLVLFNALPAFPMDGGRVLRALLAMRMNYARATGIAAAVGKAFAVLFVIFGLWWQYPFLLLIAFFVWFGASGEASMAQFRNDVSDASADSIVIHDVYTLLPDDPLEKGIESALAGFQQDFPVVVEGAIVGLLTREALLKALSSQGRSGKVADAMQTNFPTVTPDEGIDQVFGKLQAAGLRTIPVVVDGRFLGVVSTENIAEYLMLQSALRKAGNSGTHTRQASDEAASADKPEENK